MKKPYQDVRGEQYIYLLMAINVIKRRGNAFPDFCSTITVVGNINDNMLHRQFIIRNAKDGNALLRENSKDRHGSITCRYFSILNYDSEYPTINTIKLGERGGWIVDCSRFGYHDDYINQINERIGL